MSNHLNCLTKVPIFKSLSKEEMNEVLKIASHKKHQKGDLIFNEGDMIRQLFVVSEGTVKISKYSYEGKEQVLHLLNHGDFFGELSLFKDQETTSSAEVIKDSVICTLDSLKLRNLIEHNPEISFKILLELSKRLENTETKLKYYALSNSSEKLAKLLLDLEKNNIVIFPVNKSILASNIGITSETFSRTLKKFINNKYIETISNQKIIIKNKEALIELIY
ncbi:MAG: Crp/Fnr family transcriptional regulator [Acholeplasmataceae bacterium]